MIEVGLRDTGYEITLSGIISGNESKDLAFVLADELAGLPQGFGVIIDIRNLVLLEPEAHVNLEDAVEQARDLGMEKLAIVAINSGNAAVMFQMANRLNLDAGYLYLDVAADPDWRQQMIDWLQLPMTTG